MLAIITTGILLAIVLCIAALSGLFAEKSGTVNIAINGIMVGGALIYWLLSLSVDMKGWMQLVGFFVSMLGGIVIGGVFGVAAITLKANQVIAGTAMNMLFGGIGLFIWKYKGGATNFGLKYSHFRMGNTTTYDFSYIFSLILFFGLLLIIVSYLWLNHSPWGQRLKAAGENPQALDSQGISVTKTRYYGLFISGALGALAGAMFIQIQQTFTGNVAGLGFVALAIMIAGQWNVAFIFVASLVFGLLYSLGINITVMYIDANTIQPLIKAAPFALALLALVLTSKNSRAPKAAGVAYDKSKR